MRIYSFSVNGVKSIEEGVVLTFASNKKIELADYSYNKLKTIAIFGRNGSGKTSILESINILRKFILSPSELNQDFNDSQYLKNMINNKTKELDIELIIKAKECFYVYQMGIALDDNSGLLFVKYEKLGSFKSFSNIKINYIYNSLDQEVKYNQSVIIEFIKTNGNILANTLDKEQIKIIEDFYIFILNISYKSETDDYSENINYQSYYLSEEVLSAMSENISDIMLEFTCRNSFKNTGNMRFTPIQHQKIHSDVIKFKAFAKLFLKEDLLDVIPRFNQVYNENGGKVYTFEDLVFHYKDKKVSFAYESAGIKKAFILFSKVISKLSVESLIVVDELDTHFHYDIMKFIIDYNNTYGKAQLLFTAHNLSIIDDLSKYKNRVIILDNKGKPVHLKTNGNYSVLSTYLNQSYNDTYVVADLYEVHKGLTDV